MTSPPIARLRVQGLASIRDLTVDLRTPITVLIGANGSGKSNIVQALDLLGAIVDRRLQTYVAERGGFSRLVHQAGPGRDPIDSIVLRIDGEPGETGMVNGYEARLEAAADDEVLLDETLIMHDTAHHPRPYDKHLGAGRETRLTRLDAGRDRAFAHHVLSVLGSCRVYHFDDVSPDAPPKRQCLVSDNLELARDAGNLAAYLLRLRGEEPHAYRAVLDAIRIVAPFFDDFVLEPQGMAKDSLILRWRQQHNEGVFAASQLSDGTLRFICLATLLLSPHRPATIVLDEPELGLHPMAIHQLAEMLTAATHDRRRIVLATQSTDLLGEFMLDSLAVVERRAGASHVSRPDAEKLSEFLEAYSVPDLWTMNLLGGRTTAEQADA